MLLTVAVEAEQSLTAARRPLRIQVARRVESQPRQDAAAKLEDPEAGHICLTSLDGKALFIRRQRNSVNRVQALQSSPGVSGLGRTRQAGLFRNSQLVSQNTVR